MHPMITFLEVYENTKTHTRYWQSSMEMFLLLSDSNTNTVMTKLLTNSMFGKININKSEQATSATKALAHKLDYVSPPDMSEC